MYKNRLHKIFWTVSHLLIFIFIFYVNSLNNNNLFRRIKLISPPLLTSEDLKSIKFYFPGGNVTISEELTQIGNYSLNKPVILVEKLGGVFYKHMVIKLLDEFFVKTGMYTREHIPVPLIPGDDKYYYIYAEGSESVLWEIPGFSTIRGKLEEFDVFCSAFGEAGINMASDISEVEDGRSGKNIVLQWDGNIPDKIYKEAMEYNGWAIFTMPPTWYRIDLDARSCPVDYQKLHHFLEENSEKLQKVLGEERYRLLQLSWKAIYAPEEFSQYQSEFNTLIARYQYEVLKEYGIFKNEG